jgi:hypothetical protein
VRLERLVPGRRPPRRLVGAVLTRDVSIGGRRWPKGRRLSAADLELVGSDVALAASARSGLGGPATARSISVIVLEPGDVHEDDAAVRLARAVAGPGLSIRGPAQSRVDLIAETDGVAHVRVGALERVNRIDPLEVFTVFDGQSVTAGDLVAGIKVAPHVVAESVLAAGERIARRGGAIVRVAPFAARRVGVVVKETLPFAARERFERSVRQKVEGLGSHVTSIRYVEDDEAAIEAALRAGARGPERVDLILTAGAGSTDPADPLFVALDRAGGRIVRHGVPAHPGSMLWLGRIGRTTILGLPTCGAYSKATAADLLLPRLLSGEGPDARTVARLGHGGILTRSMRFRFPPYARELDAPEG